ncbi:MAG: M1 family aminopeptidase, partial [Ferruginibacter sp.]
SVFDDYQGWDLTPFLEVLEFYNDFNDYRVRVTVPKNFIVWGTGMLQNTNSVLQPAAAGRYSRSLSSDEVTTVATPADIRNGNITTQQDMNTWIFTANDIPDVAFGLSDHFRWDAGSVVVDNKTRRRASVQAAYNDTSADYHYMVNYAKESLRWLSNKWPGIPYPYAKTTIFQGYAGMEYPMMANDETYEDTTFSRFVAAHEIAHTYMPFYMGINETRYGFMDEGFATFYEYLLNKDNLGKEKADAFFRQFRVNGWASDNSIDQDQPIITPGPNLRGNGIGSNQYGKPALGYLAMKEMLGDDLFKKCLLAYMDRWHGKHPLPWDFFNSFNNVSGQNLNWFWNAWFFLPTWIDYSLEDVKKSGNQYFITIKNIGGMPAPLDLIISYADGTKETLHKTPQAWKQNLQQHVINLPWKKMISGVQITSDIYMDADTSNNTLPRK